MQWAPRRFHPFRAAAKPTARRDRSVTTTFR